MTQLELSIWYGTVLGDGWPGGHSQLTPLFPLLQSLFSSISRQHHPGQMSEYVGDLARRTSACARLLPVGSASFVCLMNSHMLGYLFVVVHYYSSERWREISHSLLKHLGQAVARSQEFRTDLSCG